MRVWLIRHASSTAAPGVAIGVTDPPLNERGRAEESALPLSGQTLADGFGSAIEVTGYVGLEVG